MKILVLGRGRMGEAVQVLATDRGHEVLGPVGREMPPSPSDWTAADVVIDFTVGSAVRGNVESALGAGRPIVIGTTGWNDDADSVRAMVETTGGTVIWGANFSVGFYVMEHLVRTATIWARAFSEFDVSLLEHHHRGKRDAPSGSALELAKILVDGLPEKKAWKANLDGGPVAEDELQVVSLRAGDEPGLHRVELGGPFDSVSVEHRVRDRNVFAAGAVFAAEQATGQTGMVHFRSLVEHWMEKEGSWT